MADQIVPDLEKSSDICCEEHGHPPRAPGRRGQPRGGGVHREDRVHLEVLRPHLALVAASSQEVFGVEGVALHRHHLACVTLTKRVNHTVQEAQK